MVSHNMSRASFHAHPMSRTLQCRTLPHYMTFHSSFQHLISHPHSSLFTFSFSPPTRASHAAPHSLPLPVLSPNTVSPFQKVVIVKVSPPYHSECALLLTLPCSAYGPTVLYTLCALLSPPAWAQSSGRPPPSPATYAPHLQHVQLAPSVRFDGQLQRQWSIDTAGVFVVAGL